MPINELQGFTAKGIGGILLHHDRLHVAVHLRVILRRSIGKIDVTVLHPIGLVKATLGRIRVTLAGNPPLADIARGVVTLLLEALRDQ